MKRLVGFTLTCLMVSLGMTSCMSTKKIVYLQGADSAYAVPKDIDHAFELSIQPDDQLAISITSKNKALIEPFNNNTLVGGGGGLSGTSTSSNTSSGVSYFTVDKNGYIYFPIFGAIKAGGKTCRLLSTEIQEKLIKDKYIQDAIVNTKIMSFKVTVLGDVKNPGVQTFTGERLTVLEAIGRAGDLNSSGKRDHVLVVREEDGKRVTYDLNLREQASIFDSPAYFLQQNDLVYVQPNKSVRVKGSSGYTYLSIGSTLVGIIVSVTSLAISLSRN